MSTFVERWTAECDVAFIVALREELQSADIFDAESVVPIPNDLDLEIHERDLQDARGKNLRTLTVLLDDQGLESAAIATTKFLQRVEVKLLVLIGISGRISSDVRLGDVVLATTCDNSFYRAKKKGNTTLPGGKEWPLDVLASRLASAIATMPAYYSYSDLDDATKSKLRQADLIRESPRTIAGAISTTTFLVDDYEFAGWLQTSRNRNILATDMESAAVVQAAHSCGVRNGRVLVIRGISDLADGKKAEVDAIGRGSIRRVAIRNAAELASHCVSRLIEFEPEDLKIRASGVDQDDESVSPYYETIDLLRLAAEQADSRKRTEAEVCLDIDSKANKNGHIWRQIAELAEASYTQSIDRRSSKHNALLQRLPRTALDYLTARWVMDSLSGDGSKPRAVEVLSKVYPQRINRFCKAFLLTRDDERHLLDGLINAYSKAQSTAKSKERAKAHICYLLGRLRSPQQKARARTVLLQWRQKLVPNHIEFDIGNGNPTQLAKVFQSIESSERRLLLRTMCISLILLEHPGESEKYVRACLRSKDFDSLNRGFHLEYYGDIDYDPSLSMNNVDPVTGQWARTFETLLEKLEGSYSKGQPYALRDVELQTLLSLAQHRHSAHVLEDHQRVRLIDFLNKWSPERLTSIRLLRAFCDMLMQREVLGSARLRRADLLRKLYTLKKLPRSGWNDKDDTHDRHTPAPESVLAHTAGGLMLIQFCLPERLSTEDKKELGDEYCRSYSKDEITRIFISHDLAEAYTGDLLPRERNDVTKAKERRVNSRIDMLSTWPGFHHFGLYRLWSDFEASSNINGKVAREIDALENLMQLSIELDEAGVHISDAEAWKDDIVQKISTPMGLRILAMLLE